MAARSTWRGAVGVGPFSVPVALYPRQKSTKDLSFKYLSKDGGPVKQAYVTKEDFDRIEADPETQVTVLPKESLRRGVEEAEDQFFVIPDASVEAIKERERSRLVQPNSYCPLHTVPRELSRASYKVMPDDKVAGSEASYAGVWNGLFGTGLAYCTQITIRGGARDSILVLYAQGDGIYAEAMPFESELHDVPEIELETDQKAANVFARFIEASDEPILEEFDHSRFSSTAQAQRQAAIDEAKEGKAITAPEPAEAPAVPDLVAALEQSIKDKGKTTETVDA